MVAAGRALVYDGSFMIESLGVVLGVGGGAGGVWGFSLGCMLIGSTDTRMFSTLVDIIWRSGGGRKWEVHGGSFGICSERGEWPLGRSWQDGPPHVGR